MTCRKEKEYWHLRKDEFATAFVTLLFFVFSIAVEGILLIVLLTKLSDQWEILYLGLIPLILSLILWIISRLIGRYIKGEFKESQIDEWERTRELADAKKIRRKRVRI